ncbi:MAG: helix-turn-helix domain-containing protein [Christensenellaceae bacterium]
MLQLSEATAFRIKELMRERSLTQYALAKKSGLSPSTLNTILAGKTPGRIDMTILNIRRGLEIEMTEFYDIDLLSAKTLSMTDKKFCRQATF